MQTIYTQLKVNNEIEVCETTDMELKQLIERELLKNRISYFIRWQKPSLFGRRKTTCVFCVNENVKDKVEEIISGMGSFDESKVKLVCRKSNNAFL